MASRREELDAIARDYRTAGDFDQVLGALNFRLMERRLRGKDVLEVGCADGSMSRRLVEVAGSLEILDASQEYLDEVAATLGERARYHCSLAEDFTPARKLDVVVATRLLEHLPRPVATWLRVRGQLHLVVPNAGSLHRRLGVAMGMLPAPDALSERDHRFGHRRVYDRALLESHLGRAGCGPRSCARRPGGGR